MFINIPFVFQLLCWTSLSFSRQQCYKCILDCLQRLLVIKTTPSQSPGLPSRPGPPPAPDPSALTPHDAEKHVSSYEKKSAFCQVCRQRLISRLNLFPRWKMCYHLHCLTGMNYGMLFCINGWLTMDWLKGCWR